MSTPAVLANQYARRTPYTIQWLFNVQRELTNDTIFEAGYLGAVSRKIEQYRSFNYAEPVADGIHCFARALSGVRPGFSGRSGRIRQLSFAIGEVAASL